ncbi:hypothetical protein AVEN_71637-1 [Araneus ventricosus]|uniref:Uncharacterized protein n=1 Tax=Araneus ventricosus TaxID=182803 RepID=A0A4Y2KKM9_ARAVE|nr:hypothetical protein AVEN_71637-1 [Araneus ventricosus]
MEGVKMEHQKKISSRREKTTRTSLTQPKHFSKMSRYRAQTRARRKQFSTTPRYRTHTPKQTTQPGRVTQIPFIPISPANHGDLIRSRLSNFNHLQRDLRR